MKLGYARISTPDQSLDLQHDALQEAGCVRIFSDVASGVRADRPDLGRLLDQLRAGDVVVIWKLDRLGRSLKELVSLTHHLLENDVGLVSLNDPVDTTTAQGRFVFNLFASLAEFERELISERTRAGLRAARARGRLGGRPRGLNKHAQQKAMLAEALYKEGVLTGREMARELSISKTTLYKYLHEREVKVGIFPQKKDIA